MPGPLVSIIVATRNSSRTLEACLRSARAQTRRNVEIIVVDNASSDGTVGIARAHADRVIVAGPERCAQRNAGIAACAGEYVLVIDSDMVLAPDVVSACLRCCGDSDAVAIDEVSFGEGFWSACKQLERSCYHGDAVVSAARFFRRSALVTAGGYDESLVATEDWDLSMRILGDAPPPFAESSIRHDEGRLTLRGMFRKKLYYGRSWPRFVRKHGVAALRRLNPARGSLVRNLGRIMRRPLLGAGLVFMKSVELTGIVLGVVLSPWISNRAVYR
ncbi:MAG TPA: glycosyltransferase [Candidatus Tyrphobacter sp.]